MSNKDHTPSGKKWFDKVTLGVAIAAVIFAGLQWYESREALLLDQRAWVNVVVPPTFPLDGSSIPASIQITNTGKTPAKNIEGDVVATVMKKGEEPSFDFSVGHPHNRIYVGAVFPNGPINASILVVRYGTQAPEPVVPTPVLRQEIANGESFIIFYGKISYLDIFGVSHWTSFCTGSGSAIGDLRKCIGYNDVDTN